MASFAIRDGQVDDLDEIHSMMIDLNVKFLKINCTPYALDQFKRDSGLLAGQPVKYFNLIVAQDNESSNLIGYLLYYFMIKTSSGRHFYIEDIFVKEAARKTGAGSSLIREAAARALATQCIGMKLHVSKNVFPSKLIKRTHILTRRGKEFFRPSIHTKLWPTGFTLESGAQILWITRWQVQWSYC